MHHNVTTAGVQTWPASPGGTDHPQRGFSETAEERIRCAAGELVLNSSHISIVSIAAELTPGFHPLDGSHSDTARIV